MSLFRATLLWRTKLRPQLLGYHRPSRKPPAVRHSGCPFSHAVGGALDGKELAKAFNMSYSRDIGFSQWLYVKDHVEAHRDPFGKCLIYLYRGDGILYVVDKGKLISVPIRAKQVWLFNDRQMHLWVAKKPCTMLVTNVSGT